MWSMLEMGMAIERSQSSQGSSRSEDLHSARPAINIYPGLAQHRNIGGLRWALSAGTSPLAAVAHTRQCGGTAFERSRTAKPALRGQTLVPLPHPQDISTAHSAAQCNPAHAHRGSRAFCRRQPPLRCQRHPGHALPLQLAQRHTAGCRRCQPLLMHRRAPRPRVGLPSPWLRERPRSAP